MALFRIAAFSDGTTGGNPAGVHLGASLPDVHEMQRIAAEVGFSETAFTAPETDGWRVRYFSPASEVPFCGHATIALGAVFAREVGEGVHSLQLNDVRITVEARHEGGLVAAALQSPPTRSQAWPEAQLDPALALFGLTRDQLDPRLPPARIHAGADHLVLALRDRETLRAMEYSFEAGRRLMQATGIVTIALVFAETPQLFHTRNAFASGGVYEDPATGASTAAFAGYLRDLGWPHGGRVDFVQGEDMGRRSRLRAEFSGVSGGSIRVSGTAREMAPGET